VKTYQYTDATNTVAHVIDEDGLSRMSMLASVLPEGVDILPADPLPPEAEPTDPVEKLRAFLAANPDVAEILQ
jgi:hypothetical protein